MSALPSTARRSLSTRCGFIGNAVSSWNRSRSSTITWRSPCA